VALASLGMARLTLGDGVGPELRRAVELERGLPVFLGQQAPSRRLGLGLALVDAFDEARAMLADVHERVVVAGHEDARAHVLWAEAELERRVGHWELARQLSDELRELAEQVSTEQEQAAFVIVRAMLDAGTGGWRRRGRRRGRGSPSPSGWPT
jgi:hypothetical protein